MCLNILFHFFFIRWNNSFNLSNFVYSKQKFHFFAILCALATTVHGYRILVLVPINRSSHWNYMQVFIKELLTRGHEVTCITSIKLTGHKYENYTEILIDPPYDMQNISKWNNDVGNNVIMTGFFFLLWRESCMK